MLIGFSFLVLMSFAPFSRAADAPHDMGIASTAPDVANAAHAHQRPVLSEKSPLAGTTIILILGLFLAAATVGPAVRYHAQEEAPDHSPHDAVGHGGHHAPVHDQGRGHDQGHGH